MPIVRCKTGLIYFAHVPKCGGTSVEHYLRRRFGPLALQDGRFLMRPASERWSKSSPQHIALADLDQLIPPAFFAESFAVVRHPVDRIISLFRYQRDIVGRIPSRVPFSRWLSQLPDRMAAHPYMLDNRPRPMCDFVPEGARIFRLEDGLERVARWIDTLPGAVSPSPDPDPDPGPIETRNSYGDKLAAVGGVPGPEVAVNAADRDRIAEIYAADFARFGYDPNRSATGEAVT